jgi:hypothetical protein
MTDQHADYVWTDDPSDPCSLCVIWDESTGKATPCLPSGPVARVWSGIHDDCERNVADYVADNG